LTVRFHGGNAASSYRGKVFIHILLVK